MEIRINEEPISFTLEDEQTLGDVYKALQSWLEDQEIYITALAINEKDIPLEKHEEWENTSLTSIHTISVNALSPQEIRFSNMNTVLEFFTLFQNALIQHNKEVLSDIMEEYPTVKESLITLFPNLFQEKDNRKRFILDDLIESSKIPQGEFPEEKQKNMLSDQIQKIKLLLLTRLNEITNARDEMKKVVNYLQDNVTEITEVSILLQTGKDQEAMNRIIRFSELIQKLLRIYPYLHKQQQKNEQPQINGKDFKSYTTDLNAILQELIEAFTAKDSVLIGDLLEYEIAPSVEQLTSELEDFFQLKDEN